MVNKYLEEKNFFSNGAIILLIVLLFLRRNGDFYFNFILNKLRDIRRRYSRNIRSVIYMRYGALPYHTNLVRQYLNEHYPSRSIGFPYMKLSIVEEQWNRKSFISLLITGLNYRTENSRRIIKNSKPGTLIRSVRKSLLYRENVCIDSGGKLK